MHTHFYYATHQPQHHEGSTIQHRSLTLDTPPSSPVASMTCAVRALQQATILLTSKDDLSL